MKNKILAAILILIVLSIYPVWRYFNNAKVFASALMDHASGVGKWTQGSISTGFDGKITIRNLTFIPNNYSQSFQIESLYIRTDPEFIFTTSASKLEYMLPETLSLSVNGIVFNQTNHDFSEALKNESMWILMAGFAGSFGCERESYTSFDDETWKSILDSEQVYNADLYYSRQENGTIDTDLILDAENLFSTTWSSNLKSSYHDKQIVVNELIVDKLFYNFLDNGFNQKRNDACKENYNSAFATYRLSSAEHVQKYLRTYFSKELPEKLINWYQRMLNPNVEYNAIITLDERMLLSDVYQIDQKTLYEKAQVEVATSQDEYLPVVLKEIDFTNKDPEFVQKENEVREKKEKEAEIEKQKNQANKDKPTVFTTGNNNSKQIPINRLSTVINKKIRIKTKKGRPVTGYLMAVDAEYASIESLYKTGMAKLTIPIGQIATVEVVR